FSWGSIPIPDGGTVDDRPHVRHVGGGQYELRLLGQLFSPQGGLPVEGEYRFDIDSATAGVTDEFDLPLTGHASFTVVIDRAGPQGRFEPVVPQQRAECVDAVNVVFDEPVVGVDLDDFYLWREDTETEVTL